MNGTTQTPAAPANATPSSAQPLTPEQRAAGEQLLREREAKQSPKKPDAAKPAAVPKENLEAAHNLLKGFMAEKKKADEPAETPEGTETPPKPAKPKQAKKPAKPDPAPAIMDPKAIAEATARGVVDGLAERDRKAAEAAKAKPPEKPTEYDWLSEDEKAELPVLRQMEKANPERYKGIADKYANAIKARQAYQAQWEKDNPGKEFNAEDEEHNDFFAKNDVDWKDRDHTDAIAELKVEARLAQERKATESRLAELKQKDIARDTEPLAQSESARLSKDFFAAIGGEFAKVRGENGAIDPEAVKKVNAEDPALASIVFTHVSQLENESAETIRLFNGAVNFDEKNPMHKRLGDYALRRERDMMTLPAEDRRDKRGRDFVPAADYYTMTPEKQKDHWTFTASDMNALLAADAIVETRKAVKQHEDYLASVISKKGYQKPDTEGGEPVVLSPVEKPVSPEGGDGPKSAPSTTTTPKRSQAGAAAFFGDFLNRK